MSKTIKLSQTTNEVFLNSYDKVLSCKDGIIEVVGLHNAMADEVVKFGTSQIYVIPDLEAPTASLFNIPVESKNLFGHETDVTGVGVLNTVVVIGEHVENPVDVLTSSPEFINGVMLGGAFIASFVVINKCIQLGGELLFSFKKFKTDFKIGYSYGCTTILNRSWKDYVFTLTPEQKRARQKERDALKTGVAIGVGIGIVIGVGGSILVGSSNIPERIGTAAGEAIANSPATERIVHGVVDKHMPAIAGALESGSEKAVTNKLPLCTIL